MPEGKLKFFNTLRGFGFVRTEGEDVMIHISAFTGGTNVCRRCGERMIANLREDTPIQFELDTETKRGRRAKSWAPV